MRRRCVAVALATVLAAFSSARLVGQTPDSVFHHGQWGVEFVASNGVTGAGLIHFRSPTRAFVLDLSGSVATSTLTSSGMTNSGNASNVVVSLGARRYRSVTTRVLFLRTLGIEGGYTHQFLAGGSQEAWLAGLFGELGASWLVTPHLALGGAWRLSADYSHLAASSGGVTNATGHQITFTLGRVQLTGQLYF